MGNWIRESKERNHISMFLFRELAQWCGFSFLGDRFSVVLIGRKLYFIVPFCVRLAYVVRWGIVLACGRQSMLTVLYRSLVCY